MSETTKTVKTRSDIPQKGVVQPNSSIFACFARAQAKFKPVKMDKEASIPRKNKATSQTVTNTYKYASIQAILDACRSALNSEGISIFQEVSIDYEQVNNYVIPKVGVSTHLRNNDGSITCSPVIIVANDTGPHAIGSAITYARRYGLSAALGVAAEEDDDGHAAQGIQPESGLAQEFVEQKKSKLSYILDRDGNQRYCIEKKMLNDQYQEQNDFILTHDLHSVFGMLRTKLGVNEPRQGNPGWDKFCNWLSKVYGCAFYDIKKDAIAGVINTISQNPSEIMNFQG